MSDLADPRRTTPANDVRRASLPFGVAVIALALLLAGCGRDAPTDGAAPSDATSSASSDAPGTDAEALPPGTLEAVALELGTALDADGRVAVVTERVRAGDAVHVSLVTVGEAEAATLNARWRDGTGTEIAADERAISAAGPAVHTFTRKPETPWTPGRYEVEVSINGESAGVRGFEVR